MKFVNIEQPQKPESARTESDLVASIREKMKTGEELDNEEKALLDRQREEDRIERDNLYKR